MGTGDGEIDIRDDWTRGPAKWFGVGVLSTLGCLALAWSALRTLGTEPVAIAEQARPARVFHPSEVGRSLDETADEQARIGDAEEPGEGAGQAGGSASDGASATADEPRADAARARRGGKPQIDRVINVNTASSAELELLPGIGAAMAERIIEERTLRGRFQRVEDLARVRGIGPKTLGRLRPHVVVKDPGERTVDGGEVSPRAAPAAATLP